MLRHAIAFSLSFAVLFVASRAFLVCLVLQQSFEIYFDYDFWCLSQEKGSNEIVVKGMGRAINKTVMIAELIKVGLFCLLCMFFLGVLVISSVLSTFSLFREGLSVSIRTQQLDPLI